MNTKTLILCIVASAIVSSIATAVTLQIVAAEPDNTPTSTNKVNERIKQLEELVMQEKEARLQLSASLKQSRFNARARLESEASPPNDLGDESEIQNNAEPTRESIAEFRQARINEWRARQQPEYRQQALVEAGFAQEEAVRILQLESEAALEQLNAQYQLRRARQNEEGRDIASQNPIRAELGDENYERYLEANGWPTKARVGSVIGGSPGDEAGLRGGDSIVSYAGQRVFSLNDINNLTVQGELGESVLVEIERDGEDLQITIPRGPIGVNGGRRGFRGR